MGHVKQKKSTSSSTSTPPEAVPNTKESAPTRREQHTRPAYPEQLNVEELISQINCRTSSNEITNDSNNNSNNNNTAHRTANQLGRGVSVSSVDVEKGPIRRHRQRPLFRRLLTFIRNLWIGAKFNVGKDGKRNPNCRSLFPPSHGAFLCLIESLVASLIFSLGEVDKTCFHYHSTVCVILFVSLFFLSWN